MLEIGPIKCSNSPLAKCGSTSLKKTGVLASASTWVNWMPAQSKMLSLPRIADTLDCLNRAQWFTSLGLKVECLQVELDEDSKPLTAFTVGPL